MAIEIMVFLVAVAMATYLTRATGGEFIVIGSMTEYIVTEQTWRWDPEAAGHVV